MTTQAVSTPETIDTATPQHVVIIGGGIAGLSTAWYLQKAQSEGASLRYTVLEQSDRWGGKVLTEQVEDVAPEPFIVEGGPDSFLAAQKPWAMQLAKELGLSERFLGTNDHKRTTYILNKRKLMNMPDGVYLIAPTKVLPFALTPLFSPLGKLRMAMDWFLPARQDNEDESLGDFIGRRMGQEAVDKLAEPLMAGIYNAVAEELSIMATFPRFRDMEKKYGSMIKGMLQSSKMMKEAAKNRDPNQPKLSMFLTFQNGTYEIIEALQDQLTGELRLNTGVTAIHTLDDGTYELALHDGSTLTAHQVILALPAFVSAKLVSSLAPQAADTLEKIRYVSTGTVSLAYKVDGFEHPLDGFGVVIPRSEKRHVNALTWTSTKFDKRAPVGHVMVRAFFGGARTAYMMDKSDAELVEAVRTEIREMMGVNAEPLFHRIYRWENSTPQYDVGHLERVDQIEANLPDGLFVTGSPYRGVGMPDCVHQGKQTAEKVTELVKSL